MVDDCRDYGGEGNDIIIRNPKIAVEVLRRLHKQIGTLFMDNDMGLGPEGKDILVQFLQDCKHQNFYPKDVYLVTDNTPARDHMKLTLEVHGYQPGESEKHWRKA